MHREAPFLTIICYSFLLLRWFFSSSPSMPFSAELAASGLERPQVTNYQPHVPDPSKVPMILLDSIKQTYSMGIILTLYQLSIKKNIHTRYIFSFSSRFNINVAVSASAWKIRIPRGFVYFLHSLPPSRVLFPQLPSHSIHSQPFPTSLYP
jgi:hypothetical protein